MRIKPCLLGPASFQFHPPPRRRRISLILLCPRCDLGRTDGGGIVARIKAELEFRGRLSEWMGEDLRMFRLNMLAEKMI